MGIGNNVVRTADGQASGPTTLDHHQARLAILVECDRAAQLLVRNNALKLQKAVPWIPEGTDILSIGAHHVNKLGSWDAVAKVDGIAVEIAYIDL